MINKSGKTFLYSLLAIVPLGIPIGLLIYGIRNRTEIMTKIKNFKLKIL